MFVRARNSVYNFPMSNELENLGFSLRIDSSKSVNYVNYQAESLLKEALGGKQNSFSFLRQIIIVSETLISRVIRGIELIKNIGI